jgi:TPR repeat protein
MGTDHHSTSTVFVVVLIAFLILGGAYFGYRWLVQDQEPVSKTEEPAQTELKRMTNLPPKEELVQPPPPPKYEPDAPVLEQAREAMRNGIGPDEAFEMAQSLPESPERADAAFLLLEYAAEAGNSSAALTLAGYYDPNDTNPSGTIRKNPATAFEWYQTAIRGGQTEAQNGLEQLRRWVREKAEQGNLEAKQLLESWGYND